MEAHFRAASFLESMARGQMPPSLPPSYPPPPPPPLPPPPPPPPPLTLSLSPTRCVSPFLAPHTVSLPFSFLRTGYCGVPHEDVGASADAKRLPQPVGDGCALRCGRQVHRYLLQGSCPQVLFCLEPDACHVYDHIYECVMSHI